MPEYSDYLEGLTPSGALTGPEKMGMSQSGAAAGWTPALMAEYLRTLGLNPYTYPFPQFTTATSTTAYTGTPSPAITAYATGQKFQVKAHATSTGDVTMNLAGIGAKKVYTTPTTQATTGDLVINSIYLMFYDAALDGAVGGFLMVGGAAPSGGGTWGSITGTLSSQTDLQTALDAKLAHTNSAGVLTDGGSITLTATKHTLTSVEAAITFSITYAGDDITIKVILNAATATYTFPAGSLCVVEGTASGANTMVLTGTSGDEYMIAIKNIGSKYMVVCKNFGQ